MIQLVVYQAFIVRNMAHQGIRTERDPHSIPGQIVGSDLLVQLQFYYKRGRYMPRVVSTFLEMI